MDESQEPLTLSAEQFAELKQLARTLIRVNAIGSIRAISREEMHRNVWLLDAAGLSQPQIALVLSIDQATVSRILSGKFKKKSAGAGEE